MCWGMKKDGYREIVRKGMINKGNLSIRLENVEMQGEGPPRQMKLN